MSEGTEGAGERKTATVWDNFLRISMREAGVAIALVIIVLFFSATAPYFATPENFLKIFVQIAINTVLAAGMTFVILTGGIDLSVGSVLALTGMITAQLMVAGFDPTLAVLIGGVGGGLTLGAINGLLVNFTGLHPFIITLGTNAIFRGVTMIISGASPVFGFSYDFVNTVTGFVGFVPVPVIFALSFAAVLWFFTAKTRLGRNIYAVGGNKESAFYSGIDVKLHTLIVFMISGLCAGLAGVLSIARLGAAEPAAGTGFETYAIAAVIIGGTSFFGGKGRIPSVVIGGLIIGTINNGLNILRVPTFYQLVVMGGLIISAVALDRLIARMR